MLHLGVDLGGSKTAIVVIDADGRERFARRAPTPGGDYESAVEALARMVRSAEREAGAPCSVGIGMPGALSPRTGLLKNAYNTVFNGRPLRADLERELQREVRIANDANCLALSEAVDGAARGARVVFGAILGTGAGGGIAVDRCVLEGRNAIAGEWGHNPLPWMRRGEYPGPRCYCGREGCIEQFVSGPALARDHRAAGGEALDAAAIVARAAAGDAACRASLDRYEDRLARALAHVVNLLDPDIIVIGGGMSNTTRLYENVPRHLPRYVYSDAIETRVVGAAHGDASGVRGAAMLWRESGS